MEVGTTDAVLDLIAKARAVGRLVLDERRIATSSSSSELLSSELSEFRSGRLAGNLTGIVARMARRLNRDDLREGEDIVHNVVC